MNAFIHDDFLLSSKTACGLYHEFAAGAPICDYHCHLDPRDLAADRRFENITQLWVTTDPYKHRAMRLAGVPERLITGNAAEREKFDAWAAVVPLTLGNPLHHWTALELKRYFDIVQPLTTDSAPRIWETCQERLREPGFTARGLLARRAVSCVCTSDRLLDDLAPHARIAGEGGVTRVLPSLRADEAVAVESPDFPKWLQALAAATGIPIRDFGSFRAALTQRLDHFGRAGARLSDHGLDDFSYLSIPDEEAETRFGRRLRTETFSADDAVRLRSAILRFLGVEYARRGWVMQLHLGARRRTSSRLRRLAGPAGGYACIGQPCDMPSLCAWFDDLERAEALPRTILYPLNPADFVPLAVLCGSFAEDGVAGKLQLGPAWWFNDHATGMRAQLDAIANHGLLATFIGMTTDSRSLLSMTRHEYFRRVLCEWLGAQVAAGTMPADSGPLGGLVRALCFDNARQVLAL
ncbi:MAG: glucuronate isomerase [Opitutaceae bacterium]|nr:glucuronate isomerase [Opitutaceae bacterium]